MKVVFAETPYPSLHISIHVKWKKDQWVAVQYQKNKPIRNVKLDNEESVKRRISELEDEIWEMDRLTPPDSLWGKVSAYSPQKQELNFLYGRLLLRLNNETR